MTVLILNAYKINGIRELTKYFEERATIYRIMPYGSLVLSGTEQWSIARHVAVQLQRREEVQFAFTYKVEDEPVVVAIGHRLEDTYESREEGWIAKKLKETPLKGHMLKRFLEEAYAWNLQRLGYARVGRKPYYIRVAYRTVKGTRHRYRLYDGFELHILRIGDDYFTVIDPRRTMTFDTNVKMIIDNSDRYDWLIGRGALAIYNKIDNTPVARHGTIRKIDKQLRVKEYKITLPVHLRSRCGREVNLKEYYACINAYEAYDINENDPVIHVNTGSTPLAYPPSVLYPIVRTDDLRGEDRSVKQLLVMPTSERVSLMRMARDAIAEAKIGSIVLRLSDESFSTKSLQLDVPELVVGGSYTFQPEIISSSSYKRSILNAIRKHGPYNLASARRGIGVVVVERHLGISRETIRQFYNRLSKVMKKYYGFKLPLLRDENIIIADNGSVKDVIEDLTENVSFVLVVLRPESEEYYGYKSVLDSDLGIPSQMVTDEVVLAMYAASTSEKASGRYKDILLNLGQGILGKIGVKLWLLAKPLKANLYVGLDIGHAEGKHYSANATLTFYDNHGEFLRSSIIPLGQRRRLDATEKNNVMRSLRGVIDIIERRRGGSVNSIVIHKDGDVYESDIRLFNDIAVELGLSVAIVSISKRAIGLRLYTVNQAGAWTAPPTGVATILDDRAGLVVTMGSEFIKQGTPRPLLIRIEYKSKDFEYTIEDAIREVFHLSFMHWQAITGKTKLPATIDYADKQSKLSLYARRIRSGITVPPL